MAAVRVGVIGCGKISGIYLENGATFDDVEIVACSDLLLERAEAQAEAYGVPRACSPEELLADEEVEIVLNLTVPVAHAEDWHPNPDFFFQPGAGPMFDMGPYYLTALTTLMGPVRRVAGSARITFPERMITSEPLSGATITVKTPTHVA